MWRGTNLLPKKQSYIFVYGRKKLVKQIKNLKKKKNVMSFSCQGWNPLIILCFRKDIVQLRAELPRL
jgi:hypothetical protein